MPTYYGDDDIDYEEETPEFRDEHEFDDYLNDEEYELISEMFPRAKNELAEYQGWNNLSVKLALFDHNFDYDEAIIDLKRTYKKKKQTEGMYNLDAHPFISHYLRSRSLVHVFCDDTHVNFRGRAW